MNKEQRLEFVDMWNAELDQIESLDITAWLRAYSQIHIRNNPGPAMELVARIDDKIRTAADTIDQLTTERDEARRLHCHMSAQFLYKSVELDTAKHVANNKNWDCFKETP
jgi:hypothetical protein